MTHKERFESLGIQPPKGKCVNMEFKIILYFIQLNKKISYIKIRGNNFENIWTTWKILTFGIDALTGVLLYGPPGTGKTLLARACAAQTKSTFLKLAGPQLVQMFIGDGAKLVRDAFALAKEKEPAIIFIDELDAIGMFWVCIISFCIVPDA